VDHPKPGLKYVKVDHLSDRTLDLSDMPVESHAREELGTVDGLIVDSESGRPYYLVVDAGHWFKSKHVLVPVGLLTLAADRESLLVSLSKTQIHGFPGVDLDRFSELTVAEIRQINDVTLQVSEPGVSVSTTAGYGESWTHPSYAMPEWWPSFIPASEARWLIDIGDTSPHFDQRAQPGDILGIETGGERTEIGDTKEDEDDRRRDAEDEDRQRAPR
jgi:hypothetical protein